MGLYMSQPTTADGYKPTSQAYSTTYLPRTCRGWKRTEPELAATFHRFIAHLLSERLAGATKTMQALME